MRIYESWDGRSFTVRRPGVRLMATLAAAGSLTSLALVASGGPAWGTAVYIGNLILWGSLFVRSLRAGAIELSGAGVVARSLDRTRRVAHGDLESFSVETRKSLLWSPRQVLVIRRRRGQALAVNDFATPTWRSDKWVHEVAAHLNAHLAKPVDGAR